MEVSFILVNYNSNDFLLKSLKSIYQYTGTITPINFEVIVVDNASSSNPKPLLDKFFPEVILLNAISNNGFGAANNLAINIAKGKFLFFLNPDAFLLSDAASVLISKMNDKRYKNMAFCSGELLNQNLTPNQSFGNFPSLFSVISACGLMFFYINYYKKHLALSVANYDSTNKIVDYVSGAAFMTKKELVESYGYFDESFFLYFEETEWAFRLKKMGFYSMIFPEVKIIHLEGGSSENDENIVFDKRKFQLYAESRQIFYKKTRGVFFARIMKPFDIIQDLVRSIYNKETKVFFEKLRILLKA